MVSGNVEFRIATTSNINQELSVTGNIGRAMWFDSNLTAFDAANNNVSNNSLSNRCDHEGFCISEYEVNGNETMFDYEQYYWSLVFYFWLWKVITPTLFGIFAVCGTIGNGLVVYVVASRPQMRTVTNVLLVSLAFADIAFLVVCVPATAFRYAADTWPFSNAACRTVNYLLYVTTYVTIYTLVAITGVRFATVVCPEHTGWLRTRLNAVVLSIAVWASALVGNVPMLPSFVVRSFGDFAWCGIKPEAVRPILISFFAVGYVVPLTAIGLLNVCILVHLAMKRRGTALNAQVVTSSIATPSVRSSRVSTVVNGIACRSRQRHMRTIRIVVPLVLVFGLSWLPLHVQSIVTLHTKLPDGDWLVPCVTFMTAFIELNTRVDSCMSMNGSRRILSTRNPFY